MSLKAILYDWGGLNAWLFHAVNDIQGDVWGQFMLLGTALADHGNFYYYLVVMVVIAVAGPRHSPQTKWSGYLGLPAVFAVGYVVDEWLVSALKDWFDFPRPLLALPPDTVHVLGEPKLHHSLPSGHTAFAALVAATIWPLLGRRGRIAAVLFVLWVGASRMALGAHFPADVLAGALISLLVCGSLWWLFGRLAKSETKVSTH